LHRAIFEARQNVNTQPLRIESSVRKQIFSINTLRCRLVFSRRF
jgi:hypothetical protein